MDRVIQTFNLLNNIMNADSHREKTALLWKSYFEMIWSRYPEDFDPLLAPASQLLLLRCKTTRSTLRSSSRFVEDLPDLDQGTELSIALLTFQPNIVHGMILCSPAGKALGVSGMSAELLHPRAELIILTLSAMFAVFMTPSWKRALPFAV